MSLQQSGSSVTTRQQLQEARTRASSSASISGEQTCAIALADKAGTIVGKWSSSTVGIRDPQEIVRITCQGIEALLSKNGSSRDALRAIAVGAPGITDTDSGIVLATSYLMGWTNVPLRDLLEAELGVPAFIDNDVNMAAFGEHAAGSAWGVDNFVFLAIGTGVGAGIVLNGEPFRGEGWIAGEIGYMLVPGTSSVWLKPVSQGRSKRSSVEKAFDLIGKVSGAKVVPHCPEMPTQPRSSTNRSLKSACASRARACLSNIGIRNLQHLAGAQLPSLRHGRKRRPASSSGGYDPRHPEGKNPRVQPHLVPSSLGAEAQINGAIVRAIAVTENRRLEAKSAT